MESSPQKTQQAQSKNYHSHIDTVANPDTVEGLSLPLRFFFALYNLLWWLARPLLKRHHRLCDNFHLRLVPDDWPMSQGPRAKKTVWIQAASGGEALIAKNLAHSLGYELTNQQHNSPSFFASQEQTTATHYNQENTALELELVCTTCTSQGLEVLQKAAKDNTFSHIRITPAYFPLDTTTLMKKALCRIAPDAVVLLETELWPSLLLTVKQKNIPLLIINGRVTKKSASAYRYFSRFFNKFGPKWIMATKSTDAERFKKLFPQAYVESTPNIKFDIAKELLRSTDLPKIPCPRQLANAPDSTKIVLFASVRQEEEEVLLPTIKALALEKTDRPLLIIAPRHLHRARPWVKKLEQSKINALLCSEKKHSLPHDNVPVIVWDRFGELPALYALCTAVFVGGSFAPLGGQNFLEPLAFGKTPFVGPYLKNFAWTGKSLFHEGLVTMLSTPEELTSALLKMVDQHSPSQCDGVVIQQQFSSWLAKKTGGSAIAAKKLLETMHKETIMG